MKNVQSISVFLCLILFTTVGKANFYNNGQVNNIDFEIPSGIIVENGQSSPTTVNLLTGGSIGGIADLRHASIFNIYNGSVYGIDAQGVSKVNLMGGSVGGGRLKAWGGTQVMISGGNVGDITVSFDNSQLTITSGSVGQVEGYSTQPIMISGGQISGPLLLARFDTNDTRTIIYGSDFAVNGVGVDYGVIPQHNLSATGWSEEPFRTLTGTLANGNSLNMPFKMIGGAYLVLVPEPATLGLILIGGVILSGRRK